MKAPAVVSWHFKAHKDGALQASSPMCQRIECDFRAIVLAEMRGLYCSLVYASVVNYLIRSNAYFFLPLRSTITDSLARSSRVKR
jgi:hypothetical protein